MALLNFYLLRLADERTDSHRPFTPIGTFVPNLLLEVNSEPVYGELGLNRAVVVVCLVWRLVELHFLNLSCQVSPLPRDRVKGSLRIMVLRLRGHALAYLCPVTISLDPLAHAKDRLASFKP